LNHAGVENSNIIVILNDNCMSIDPNVGALKEYLTDITTSPTYNKFKDDVWKALNKLDKVGKFSSDVISKILWFPISSYTYWSTNLVSVKVEETNIIISV
jgi:1-deoxy-D-xylulose-5-phosphate synthase